MYRPRRFKFFGPKEWQLLNAPSGVTAARVPSAGLGSPLSTRAKKIVEAPPDGAAAGDKKEREAVKDRALAGVQYRPKTLGKMILKISDGHLAADDEGCVAGEQPNRDQDAAEKIRSPRRTSIAQETAPPLRPRPGHRRRRTIFSPHCRKKPIPRKSASGHRDSPSTAREISP